MIVELADLRFRWPRAAADCLDIPAMRLAEGERVFLHGPSGSGKSTLLGLLGGVLLPQRGRIEVLGRDITSMRAAARDRFRVDHIGFIFQQFNLLPHLSVMENVLLPCRFSARRRSRTGLQGATPGEAARQLLGKLGMASELHARAVTDLSVGQQQRVAAARALIGRPELIVADEPTSALDADRQRDFVELLLAECAQSGAAVLFVSHDRRLAAHFDRVLALPEINRMSMEPA
jgi:putative ABC transport system ATP-binding protein